MCRRTMQAAFADLGETGKLRVFDQLNDVRVMADLDAGTFIDIRRVIFGSDNDPYPDLPTLDDQQAGMLVEIIKDLLYQVYVRKGRLQQAMMMRRFFARRINSRPHAAEKHAVGLSLGSGSPPRPNSSAYFCRRSASCARSRAQSVGDSRPSTPRRSGGICSVTLSCAPNT